MLMLETFQIRYLPDRVAVKEFSTLLRTYPVVQRFLEAKYPPIGSFISRIMEENMPVGDKMLIEKDCQEALWEIADLILYNKNPDLYDSLDRIKWDISEINTITSLNDKVVADVGAGSGRIAFLLAPFVQTVFAIEPVASFRSFMKEKAANQEVSNLYVLDGTLDSIPLPDHTLDVLITSNAIGWNLLHELKEIERAVNPGGMAVHLLLTDTQQENPLHDTLVSAPWNYSCLEKIDDDKRRIRYYKTI